MTRLAFFLALTGCDRVFGVDQVGFSDSSSSTPTDGPASGDSGDGSDGQPTADSAMDALDAMPDSFVPPVDSALDLIRFTGFASTWVCEQTTAQGSVRLDFDPGATTIVTVASSDASYISVAPATLMFDSSNWNTPQPITATGQMLSSPITITVSSPNVTSRMDSLIVRPFQYCI